MPGPNTDTDGMYNIIIMCVYYDKHLLTIVMLFNLPLCSVQVEALMDYTVQQHGRIDYLVNNGGGQFMSPLAYMKTKGWNAVIDTNLNGTYYCLKHGQ